MQGPWLISMWSFLLFHCCVSRPFEYGPISRRHPKLLISSQLSNSHIRLLQEAMFAHHCDILFQLNHCGWKGTCYMLLYLCFLSISLGYWRCSSVLGFEYEFDAHWASAVFFQHHLFTWQAASTFFMAWFQFSPAAISTTGQSGAYNSGFVEHFLGLEHEWKTISFLSPSLYMLFSNVWYVFWRWWCWG